MPLTPEEKQSAIQWAFEGLSQREIVKRLGISVNTFYQARNDCPLFQKRYIQAREEGMEILADDLLDIYDEYADPQKARGKSDNIKWLLSKRKSHIYGDKLDINLNQTVDIGVALTEARRRALPAVDAEFVEIKNSEADTALVALNSAPQGLAVASAPLNVATDTPNSTKGPSNAKIEAPSAADAFEAPQLPDIFG